MDAAYRVSRVLLLEDDPFQRDLTVSLLSDCGVEHIWTAANGEQALELTRAHPVQVLICDLQTPGMDGIELIKRVADASDVEALIIASGMNAALIHTVEEMARTYRLQVLGAVEKPLTRRSLTEMFARFVEAGQPAKPREVARSLTLEEIGEGIRRHEIEPYFQPKVSLSTQECVGVEALARWHHPNLGVLPPSAFIPRVENTPLMGLLTWSMIEKSIAAWRSWGRKAWRLSLSINCSADVLCEQGVVERIASFVTAQAVEPSNVTWEVTESVLGRDTAQLLATLARLRLRGFGLSIDDFGTGFSSMRQLSRISFTELKVDRSFVHRANSRHHLRVILESSLELARRLNLKAVAEGVETREDWNLLRELQCDTAQGYLIAKPMPADAFYQWHDRWTGL